MVHRSSCFSLQQTMLRRISRPRNEHPANKYLALIKDMSNMAQAKMLDDVNSSLSPNTTTPSPNSIVEEYFLRNVAEFKELMELKQRGWDNRKGDDYFKVQRVRAEHADDNAKRAFYNMMCQIGDELHTATSAFSLPTSPGKRPSVLDLCMAHGGFTASVLKHNPTARVYGISLPPLQGGHKIMLPQWQTDPRIRVHFLDITMLAAEMGVTDIPPSHPDAPKFLPDRPFPIPRFDLIFCNGQVVRRNSRDEYRERCEASRLLTSQLVLALQRIKEGGKIIALLHKVEAWDTVVLLHTLSQFSSLRLFKPERKHGIRSSFYVVAEQIQPQSVAALQAVATWKKEWYVATFGSEREYRENRDESARGVEDMLVEFGAELVRLGRPVCRIQCNALRNASFT